MFYREPKKSSGNQKRKAKHLEPVVTHQVLLLDKKRRDLLDTIQGHLNLSFSEFKSLAEPLIHNMAEFFQYLPDSTLYYARRGGLLDHALNRTEAALGLMQQLMLSPHSQAGPSDQQRLWLYAVFTAGLLRGAGKVYSEYDVALYDKQENFLGLWDPIHANMAKQGASYDFEFTIDITEPLCTQVTILMAKRLMPEAGLSWIGSDTKVFYAWLSLLADNREGAGALSAILDRADAMAYQRYLLLYLEENKHLLEQARVRVGTFQDNNPDHSLEKERVLGAEFLTWVRHKLSDGRIIINHSSREASLNPNGMVLSAEIFDQFMQEHLKIKKNKFLFQRSVRAWNPGLPFSQQQADQAADNNQPVILDKAMLPEHVKIMHSKTGHISTVQTLDLLNDIQAYTLGQESLPLLLERLNEKGLWVNDDQALAARAQFGRNPNG